MTNDIRYGRKISGIKKELRNKIKDWVDSIEDQHLAEDVFNNTIVTGGAIASMLLGEKINDFDVYLKDPKVTEELALYYADQLPKRVRALTCVLSPDQIKEDPHLLDQYPEYNRVITRIEGIGMWSSGAKKKDKKKPYHLQHISDNAITLSDKIQIVTRFFGTPEEVQKSFDFQHAMCSWDNGEEKLILPEKSLLCMMSRSLKYEGSLYPIASIFRAKKFLARGWRISAGDLLKIMWQISELDLNNIYEVREQLTGVDLLYLGLIMKALESAREKDPDLMLTAGFVKDIIEEIFDGEQAGTDSL